MGDTAKCEKCGSDVPPGGACPRCALAAALPAADAGPTADEVAAKLPTFEILGVLGRGGMGVVFKARQKALDRIVALKVLPPATAQTPGFADRFQREAKAMARLAHPNIVAVHEFGDSGGLFYLVLEFVDGLNVREAMTAGRIRPGEALTIVPQICDALQYAHDRGVVHRDIKPENVMIDREGRVRIADFGLAKLADRESGDPSLTGAGQVMGTLRYMAPEQWERPKEVDHRADIYSLGVVFYEMLTGELPMGKFEPPSSKAQIDVRIDDVVMRAIERDRERRWQHASDVKTQMGVISSGAAASPPAVAGPPTGPAPRGFGEAVAAFAAATMSFGGAVAAAGLAALLNTLLIVAGIVGVMAACFDKEWRHLLWATPALIAGVWWARRSLRSNLRADAAPAASDPPRPEPAAMKQSLLPVVIPLLVAILCGVIAIVVTPNSPGTSTVFWWLAGLTFFATIVVAVVCWDRALRGVRGPPWPFDSKDESDEEEPEPKGKWLPPRTTALVTLAGVSAAAGLFGGFGMSPAGMTISGVSFMLGMVLWYLCDERKKSVVAAEKGEREQPGPPVAIDILSAVTIVVGLIGVGHALFAKEAPDDEEPGTSVQVGPFAVTVKSNSSAKATPSADDKAPWEFVVEATSGETPPQSALDGERQGVWQAWSRAQALQASEWNRGFDKLYGPEDFSMLDAMSADARRKSADDGLLGLPMFPRDRAALAKYHIESARLGGWRSVHFDSAVVRATDGEKTLKFTMRFAAGWCFAAAPVELE